MDANGATEDHGFIGFLYLDLFTRTGVKSPGDGGMDFLIDGFVRPDGCREYPAAAALTGFDKSEDENDKPSLIFPSRAAVKWREEQGNAAAALPLVTVPDDLIAQYLDSDKLYAGLDILRDVFYAFYDQSIYNTTEEADVAANTDLSVLYNRLKREIGLVPDHSDWCQVYAEDVFHTAFASNLFDSEVGWRYRQQILQPGGSKNLINMLVGFLGHEPNTNGFYKYLGISGT
ncbi:hypothetical protein TI39_contig303g00043 [Zymoseptoria brevis]|uniref:Peptidase M3A/M3B catalytic domain-containing protein n=1 Tax=Zymoseptoria brevis TaxID=1047168 RepID=A0A0F4GVL8_9PEZI|nr:hypothetical protein TI39_contig303g00043 [Zymoseptoria brevis]